MELASKMRKAGAAVDLVILLDACLPQGRRRNWRRWLSFQAAQVMNGNASKRLRERLGGIVGGLGARLPSASRGDSGNASQFVATRRAAFLQVIGKWRARDPQFDFHTILFRALDRPARTSHLDYEEDYGWRRFLTGNLTVMDVPGSHLSIVNPPDVALLGSLSRQYLRPAPDMRAVPEPNNIPADRT